MKYLAHINWVILGLLFIFSVFQLLTLNSSGMDAAGRGMAGGFTLILLIIVGILALVNLIQSDYARVAVLVTLIIGFMLVM